MNLIPRGNAYFAGSVRCVLYNDKECDQYALAVHKGASAVVFTAGVEEISRHEQGRYRKQRNVYEHYQMANRYRRMEIIHKSAFDQVGDRNDDR